MQPKLEALHEDFGIALVRYPNGKSRWIYLVGKDSNCRLPPVLYSHLYGVMCGVMCVAQMVALKM